jgi:hypothetical protein
MRVFFEENPAPEYVQNSRASGLWRSRGPSSQRSERLGEFSRRFERIALLSPSYTRPTFTVLVKVGSAKSAVQLFVADTSKLLCVQIPGAITDTGRINRWGEAKIKNLDAGCMSSHLCKKRKGGPARGHPVFSPPTLSAKDAERVGHPALICDLGLRVEWVGRTWGTGRHGYLIAQTVPVIFVTLRRFLAC